MDRTVLDKVIFYFRNMLSYRNYIDDDITLLNKVYIILGKQELLENDETNKKDYKYFINNIVKIALYLLENLEDNEKRYFLDQLPKFVKISLLDDNKKLEELDNLNSFEKKVIIQSLKYTDEEKLGLIEKEKDSFSKIELIKSLQDDNKKILLLKSIENDSDRLSIIESLQDDDKKIELLQDITKENNRIRIIKSLQSDDKKIRLLKTISNQSQKANVIATINEDEAKCELIKEENFDDEEDITTIVKSLKNDDKKINLLDNIYDEDSKTKIIESIQDDEKKIAQLKKIKSKIKKIKVIKSLQDDDKKISILDYVKEDQFTRKLIIESLENDDKKITMLRTLTSEIDRCNIIKGMQTDDGKIEALKYLENLNFKLEVIETFNDDIKKDNELKKIDSKLERVYQTIAEFEKGKKNDTNKYESVNIPEEMTFGIEIEAAGKYGMLLPRELKNWKRKTDDSIGKDGIEIASPIMHDNKEYVNEIYKINEILRSIGMEATQNCGAHVHIGADYIKNEEGFKQLIELWGNAEQIYYLISNAPGELPRDYVNEYARPISKNFENSDLNEQDSFIEDAKRIQAKRKTSLNLLNVNDTKNTIEFRLSNGTLNGDTWIENICLYGRTVQIAEELGEIVKKIESGQELTKEEKTKYALKEMLKEERALDEKMEILMQILFDEEERRVYQERYNVNKEQNRKVHRIEKLQFGKVDFKKVYDDVGITEEFQKLQQVETHDKCEK